MVASEITISLRDLKFSDSPFRKLAHQKEARFRQEALISLPSSDRPSPAEIPQRVLFDHGYRSGFADAITIAEDYKSRMNDPSACTEIASLVVKLEKVQAQFNDTADGELLTFKGRKYVM